MSASTLSRGAGPIALGAGALFTAAQLAVYVALDRTNLAASAATWAYRVSAVALLLAFAGLAVAACAVYTRAAAKSGVLGAIGVSLALTGTVLLAGDWWFETFAVAWYADVAPEILDIKGGGWLAVGGLASYSSFALGWAVFGLALYRSRAVAPVACLGVIVGGIVGYAAALPPCGVPLGLAVGWLGVAMIRDTPRRGAPAMSLHHTKAPR